MCTPLPLSEQSGEWVKCVNNQWGNSADTYCCQQLLATINVSYRPAHSDLRPLTSMRYFSSTHPPLIGYFSFLGSSSVKHRSSCDVLKNPSWSAFCDTLTCSPIWHRQQCSTRSKWLKSFFFFNQTDACFEHGHMPECTESLLCNWHNTSVCSHALTE